MIKAIIIDDEMSCIESLKYDLQKHCADVQVIDTCLSPKEGLLSIRHNQPALVFLDVQMPWMNGFEMLEVLEEINFAIIFITAFDQFAAKAFRISAIDYLLKPIDVRDLKEAVDKAAQKIIQQTGSANIDNLLHNMAQPDVKQRIAFPGRDGHEFVEIENIIYAKAEGAYTHVMLKGGRKLVISKTLSDIMEMLPPAAFQRIHNSSLVNVAHITHFLRTDGGYVVLNNGEKLMVSKSKKDSLLEKLGLK
jgi:two-component system LytT family response regulator